MIRPTGSITAAPKQYSTYVETIDWPAAFIPDARSDRDLDPSLDYGLSDDARTKARERSERAANLAEEVLDQFLAELESRG
jgi:hypothetical protein